MYVLCAASMAFANLAVGGVPLSAGIYFSMLLCGTHIIASPLLFIAASAVHANLTMTLLSLFEGVFPALVVFLYRRTGRKIRIEAVAYFIITLAPYVVFAPWQGVDFFEVNDYAMRGGAAAVILLFTYFSFRSLYALMFRVGRCRLKEDELVSLGVVYAVVGAGLFSQVGAEIYLCFCVLAVTYSVRLARSPSALVVALILALPQAAVTVDLQPMTALIIISTAALLFSGAGKFAAGAVTGACAASYLYFTGGFDCAVPFIVLRAILLFFACFIPSLPSEKNLEELKRRLMVQDVLPETAVERSRRRTGERLFRISEVFREIECAFLALDENIDDSAARERMIKDLRENCCKGCERAGRCAHSEVYVGFKKLIDAGCVKGKVNIIDLPSEMTLNCSRPSDVMNRLNALLVEYRRYMLDAENASSGRQLLADQAKGVAEVMKSCAVELGRVQGSLKQSEESVKKALAVRGVSCPELYIDGEEGEVCAVTMGKTDVKKVIAVLSDELGRGYALKDKFTYDSEKSCYIFGSPPAMDAAFGMAYAIKKGERVSGDTHSVIRVNDHTFLMALSDGMGSGEYARKVSEAAISLIEAFYRAQMPEDTVLKTINKLLSFNRDERFTCIDIAAVNLDTGRADFVKIGSPAGVIIREGEIKVLESSSLPLGILENLRPAVCTEYLKSGDIVVFMSDGITSAFPTASDLYGFLQELKPLNPQSLADKILQAALDRTKKTAADDMTVICTRLFDNT